MLPLRPPRHNGTARFASRLAVMLLGAVLALALGCQPKRAPQREVFEEAEQGYRIGHYDKALEKYKAFLKAAPDHQLAPLAQQRVLSIERELEVVMQRGQGPRPIYLRPVPDEEIPARPRPR